MVIDCNAVPADEVLMKEDTVLGHQAETEAHAASVAPALTENVNEALLLSLPEDDPIPLSHASTDCGGETEGVEAPVKSLEEIEADSEATDEVIVEATFEAPIEATAEVTAEELAFPGHQRKEHPTA